jgi:hypothetical protein
MQELSTSHIIMQQHFKVSMHWLVAVVDEQVLSSLKNFTTRNCQQTSRRSLLLYGNM